MTTGESTIESGAVLHLDAQGHPRGQGHGAGVGVQGAGHGGQGGVNQPLDIPAAAYDNVYRPRESGSGGGGVCGGSGGGRFVDGDLFTTCCMLYTYML